MKKVLEIIEKFTRAKEESLIDLKIKRQEGVPIVGTYCSFVPSEIILAAGAIPIRLCATNGKNIELGERHLPRNLCPLVKATYGTSIAEESYHYGLCHMIVGETTCDGKKKMYEYLRRHKPMQIMQLPQNFNEDISLKHWKNEIVRLKERLEEEFDVEIREENIREAIKKKNQERKILLEFNNIAKNYPDIISGLQIYNVMIGMEYRIHKDEAIEEVKELTKLIKYRGNSNESSKCAEDKPEIMVTGCPMGESMYKIINSVEENGGSVVCVETCDSLKSIDELVDEDRDVMEALAKKYLNIGCPVMTPNDNRMKLINKLVDKYEIDGVIDVVLQACLCFNVETVRMKRFINEEKNIPYIALNTDYSTGDTGQLETRITAFLENISYD